MRPGVGNVISQFSWTDSSWARLQLGGLICQLWSRFMRYARAFGIGWGCLFKAENLLRIVLLIGPNFNRQWEILHSFQAQRTSSQLSKGLFVIRILALRAMPPGSWMNWALTLSQFRTDIETPTYLQFSPQLQLRLSEFPLLLNLQSP